MSKLSTEEIYAEVNARILAALEQGTAPWQKPWVGEHHAPRNLQSGKPYRGINALLLAISGYDDPRWTTFAAARKMGASVRKGEKSTLVTLWKRIKIKDKQTGDDKIIPILRYFRVFNVEQIDFPEGALKPLPAAEPAGDWNPVDEADKLIDAFTEREGAPSLVYTGSQAYYMPATHSVTLPPRGKFRQAHGFYGTAFHEFAHATSHPDMLNREIGGRFGSSSYAREELIAEMAAAFVCATLEVDGGFTNTVAYLKHWARAIKDDPKMFVTAAGKAQKASDCILGIEYVYTEPESNVDPSVVADKEEVVA